MLYNLFAPLAEHSLFFNLFRYITFRTGCALITALLICFMFGPAIIRWLKSKQTNGQPIRTDGPETHLAKAGTPTMGGVMILLAIGISTLLWADLSNRYVWMMLITTIGFGSIGFVDDYLKLTRRNAKGLSGRLRLLLEFLIAATVGFALIYSFPENLNSHLSIPVFKSVLIDLGWFFIPFVMFVIVGSANSVNLTDGLDGLAIVPIMIAALSFGIITYLVGNVKFADYLQVNYIAGSGELAIFCGALVGASLGFLWFNAPPAEVFMGDTGSLATGSALGTISVITKHELVWAVIGGLFVVEALSVIIQVAYFKQTGRRIFLMAPLHHHFEKLGWKEPTIVIRFWIIACILALAGLSTLKLR
ncbi:MAG TPA: phospho-N-acetylmuramoyl-pentapeptide-transferase [Alphaproteobacteria bacterium]|nr:phospho-N-acetylmuramoyl-pentapeptide-transferase [Alphaproteobacteria bacterium]